MIWKQIKNLVISPYIFGKMKKKGWIKLAEAFISILIIGSLLAVMITERRGLQEDFSHRIEVHQTSLLNLIQINETIREEVLELVDIPKESGEVGFPPVLNSTLSSINTNLIECFYKICAPGEDCLLENMPNEKEIYINSRIISANQEVYNPRNLNLFCWEK